jgi:hypothetical protein
MSWDDPKPTKSTPVQINVKVPEHCERFLRLLAASLGYTRGKSASIREFLIALGNGQYRLVPGSLSPNGIETLNLIVDRILSQNTFCVCVKSGDGLTNYTVLSGTILIDSTGKNFLMAYTKENNPLEIEELSNNFAIEIEHITSIENSHLPWSSFVPYIPVEFWLDAKFIYRYLPSADDVSSVPSEVNNRMGTLITRKVSSSELLISELISYQDNCFLISPNSLQHKIIHRLSKNLSLYGDDSSLALANGSHHQL